MLTLALIVVPIGVRFFVASRFAPRLRDILSEDELDREGHRSLIMALAGFSFSAVAALAVLDVSAQLRFGDALVLLLGSFLAYLWSLNLQSYKFRRWHDMLGSALVELATLSMVVALCTMVEATSLSASAKLFAFFLAGAVWLSDFLTKISLEWQYLNGLSQAPPQV